MNEALVLYPGPIRGPAEILMTEASWGEGTMSPDIDWRMSASLENVPRGGSDLAEVTSLVGAVEAWQVLDPEHRVAAVLTPERPLVIDGASIATFEGETIATLAERLPKKATDTYV